MSPQLYQETRSEDVLTVGNRPWPPCDADTKRAVKVMKITQPVRDPSEIYPEVEGLPNTYETFRLSSDGLTDGEREQALTAAKAYHSYKKAHFMGYQGNQELHYSKRFSSYLDTLLNNIGDPYDTGNTTLSSKFMERPLLDYYASLWNARWPHDSTDPESYWGYALTMGCSEGNLYGMWNARDYLGGRKITSKVEKQKTASYDGANIRKAPCPDGKPNAYTPIVFYSQETHYSITKAVTMLAIRTFYEEGDKHYKNQCPLAGSGGEWPAEVPCEESGAIDIDALVQLVEFFAKEGYPILVCFNYGTTFKGAYDDVGAAGKRLMPILEKYNLHQREVHYNLKTLNECESRTGFWFHVDGALGAAYMPFVEMAYNAKLTDQRGPDFDFRLPFVNSITMSGHKWIGAPLPCGLFMTKVKYQMLPRFEQECIGTPDTTFAGSRNGLSPMLLWEFTSRNSHGDQIKMALRQEALTQYTERRLLELARDVLKTDLWVTRTPLALSVRFKQANDTIVLKYSLCNETWRERHYSHVFLMPHVSTNMVEELINDLSQEGAFLDQTTTAAAARSPLKEANNIAPEFHRLSLVPQVAHVVRG